MLGTLSGDRERVLALLNQQQSQPQPNQIGPGLRPLSTLGQTVTSLPQQTLELQADPREETRSRIYEALQAARTPDTTTRAPMSPIGGFQPGELINKLRESRQAQQAQQNSQREIGSLFQAFAGASPSQKGVPKGLKPNAERGAAFARQMGFNGVMGGIGKRKNKSDHPHGNAIDLMTNENMAQGYALANAYIQNAKELGVKYVIFDQKIASPSTGWKWKPMEDRGSPTANHKDHPHISFY